MLHVPRCFSLAVAQVRHVERGEMLGVRRAVDVGVAVVVHEFAHVARDGDEVCHDAVVHECVPAEDERVVVHLDDWRGGCGADVREARFGSGVCADAFEVEIVGWWGCFFVQSWIFAFAAVLEFGFGSGVPCYAETVDVEESVAGGDFGFGGLFVEVVGEEFR